jgi:D-beta-D-heptose 7-phosphate kinase/D-beta-D-heptose 1-phosphate adenosyltransferase
MAITSGIFSAEVNFEERLVESLDALADRVENLKGMGLRVVLTSGSFDLIHVGHVKYLARAKELGDVLVVGVDSDEKIRKRKGDDRPLVPEGERLEMLAHQRPVDLLFLKQDEHERWDLIKAVRPDVLVVSTDNDSVGRDEDTLREYCGDICVIDRQASVSTSERIRQLYMHLGERLGPKLAEVLPGLIDSVLRRG